MIAEQQTTTGGQGIRRRLVNSVTGEPLFSDHLLLPEDSPKSDVDRETLQFGGEKDNHFATFRQSIFSQSSSEELHGSNEDLVPSDLPARCPNSRLTSGSSFSSSFGNKIKSEERKMHATSSSMSRTSTKSKDAAELRPSQAEAERPEHDELPAPPGGVSNMKSFSSPCPFASTEGLLFTSSHDNFCFREEQGLPRQLGAESRGADDVERGEDVDPRNSHRLVPSSSSTLEQVNSDPLLLRTPPKMQPVMSVLTSDEEEVEFLLKPPAVSGSQLVSGTKEKNPDSSSASRTRTGYFQNEASNEVARGHEVVDEGEQEREENLQHKQVSAPPAAGYNYNSFNTNPHFSAGSSASSLALGPAEDNGGAGAQSGGTSASQGLQPSTSAAGQMFSGRYDLRATKMVPSSKTSASIRAQSLDRAGGQEHGGISDIRSSTKYLEWLHNRNLRSRGLAHHHSSLFHPRGRGLSDSNSMRCQSLDRSSSRAALRGLATNVGHHLQGSGSSSSSNFGAHLPFYHQQNTTLNSSNQHQHKNHGSFSGKQPAFIEHDHFSHGHPRSLLHHGHQLTLPSSFRGQHHFASSAFRNPSSSRIRNASITSSNGSRSKNNNGTTTGGAGGGLCSPEHRPKRAKKRRSFLDARTADPDNVYNFLKTAKVKRMFKGEKGAHGHHHSGHHGASGKHSGGHHGHHHHSTRRGSDENLLHQGFSENNPNLQSHQHHSHETREKDAAHGKGDKRNHHHHQHQDRHRQHHQRKSSPLNLNTMTAPVDTNPLVEYPTGSPVAAASSSPMRHHKSTSKVKDHDKLHKDHKTSHRHKHGSKEKEKLRDNLKRKPSPGDRSEQMEEFNLTSPPAPPGNMTANLQFGEIKDFYNQENKMNFHQAAEFCLPQMSVRSVDQGGAGAIAGKRSDEPLVPLRDHALQYGSQGSNPAGGASMTHYHQAQLPGSSTGGGPASAAPNLLLPTSPTLPQNCESSFHLPSAPQVALPRSITEATYEGSSDPGGAAVVMHGEQQLHSQSLFRRSQSISNPNLECSGARSNNNSAGSRSGGAYLAQHLGPSPSTAENSSSTGTLVGLVLPPPNKGDNTSFRWDEHNQSSTRKTTTTHEATATSRVHLPPIVVPGGPREPDAPTGLPGAPPTSTLNSGPLSGGKPPGSGNLVPRWPSMSDNLADLGLARFPVDTTTSEENTSRSPSLVCVTSKKNVLGPRPAQHDEHALHLEKYPGRQVDKQGMAISSNEHDHHRHFNAPGSLHHHHHYAKSAPNVDENFDSLVGTAQHEATQQHDHHLHRRLRTTNTSRKTSNVSSATVTTSASRTSRNTTSTSASALMAASKEEQRIAEEKYQEEKLELEHKIRDLFRTNKMLSEDFQTISTFNFFSRLSLSGIFSSCAGNRSNHQHGSSSYRGVQQQQGTTAQQQGTTGPTGLMNNNYQPTPDQQQDEADMAGTSTERVMRVSKRLRPLFARVMTVESPTVYIDLPIYELVVLFKRLQACLTLLLDPALEQQRENPILASELFGKKPKVVRKFGEFGGRGTTSGGMNLNNVEQKVDHHFQQQQPENLHGQLPNMNYSSSNSCAGNSAMLTTGTLNHASAAFDNFQQTTTTATSRGGPPTTSMGVHLPPPGGACPPLGMSTNLAGSYSNTPGGAAPAGQLVHQPGTIPPPPPSGPQRLTNAALRSLLVQHHDHGSVKDFEDDEASNVSTNGSEKTTVFVEDYDIEEEDSDDAGVVEAEESCAATTKATTGPSAGGHRGGHNCKNVRNAAQESYDKYDQERQEEDREGNGAPGASTWAEFLRSLFCCTRRRKTDRKTKGNALLNKMNKVATSTASYGQLDRRTSHNGRSTSKAPHDNIDKFSLEYDLEAQRPLLHEENDKADAEDLDDQESSCSYTRSTSNIFFLQKLDRSSSSTTAAPGGPASTSVPTRTGSELMVTNGVVSLTSGSSNCPPAASASLYPLANSCRAVEDTVYLYIVKKGFEHILQICQELIVLCAEWRLSYQMHARYYREQGIPQDLSHGQMWRLSFFVMNLSLIIRETIHFVHEVIALVIPDHLPRVQMYLLDEFTELLEQIDRCHDVTAF
ncbi:unnamed protein product [Amoebophrya sp. A120]|nr:unnamed protein product [Amoebophrya sp. A120]|eukprot:GSA120T00023749001.1